MKKRICAVLLALSVCLALCTGTASAARSNPFADVPANAYYLDAVLWALDRNITSGVDAKHFEPGAATTRAQMVTFLWRASGSPAPSDTSSYFTDVPAGAYYARAVLWAAENGITAGVDRSHFDPNGIVSRAQAVTFLYRLEGFDPLPDRPNPFTDVAKGDWFCSAALWAAGNGITAGTGGGAFSPADGCQRAQVVTFLYRYFNR